MPICAYRHKRGSFKLKYILAILVLSGKVPDSINIINGVPVSNSDNLIVTVDNNVVKVSAL